MQEQWITTKKVSEITGLDRDTVAAYCRDEKFTCIKPGRDWLVWYEDVKKFQKSHVGRPSSKS